MAANYEVLAQFQVLQSEAAEAARRLGLPKEQLLAELARQTMVGNLAGYVRLVLTHYVGQWSVASLWFPPTATAVNRYVAAYPSVPFESQFDPTHLRPPARRSSYVVYPAFLAIGGVTLVLSLLFAVVLVRPSLADGPGSFPILVASFLSAMCQGYTIGISLMNVSTPRFLMAVYPELALVVVFLLWMGWRNVFDRPSAP